jgi:hypothetical protein
VGVNTEVRVYIISENIVKPFARCSEFLVANGEFFVQDITDIDMDLYSENKLRGNFFVFSICNNPWVSASRSTMMVETRSTLVPVVGANS